MDPPSALEVKGLKGVHAPERRQLICQLRTLKQEKREEELQPTNMKA